MTSEQKVSVLLYMLCLLHMLCIAYFCATCQFCSASCVCCTFYALHIFVQRVSSTLLVVCVAHCMHCTFLLVLLYLLCVVHIGNESCQQRTENTCYCDVCVTEIWYTCCTICSKLNDKAKILDVSLKEMHIKPTVKRISLFYTVALCLLFWTNKQKN